MEWSSLRAGLFLCLETGALRNVPSQSPGCQVTPCHPQAPHEALRNPTDVWRGEWRGWVCGAAALSPHPSVLLVPRTVCGSGRAQASGCGVLSLASRCFSTHFIHKAPGPTPCCGWRWGLDLWGWWGHMDFRPLISGWFSHWLPCLWLPPLPHGFASQTSQQTCTRRGRMSSWKVGGKRDSADQHLGLWEQPHH